MVPKEVPHLPVDSVDAEDPVWIPELPDSEACRHAWSSLTHKVNYIPSQEAWADRWVVAGYFLDLSTLVFCGLHTPT